MNSVLVLCTANQCRSVMAEALLRHRLAVGGVTAAISSAGLLGDGAPPPPEVISALAAYGLDAASHHSRRVTADDLTRADLVLAMTREHLRHAVVMDPAAWPRAFTLKELVRRGQLAGPRAAAEPLARWLGRAHAGRDRLALMGDSPADDIADPVSGPPAAYAATVAQLDHLLAQLAALAWGQAVPR